MGHFSLSADEQKAPSFVHTHFLKASALQAQKSGGEKCFIDLGVRRHRPRTSLAMDKTLNLPVSLWGGLNRLSTNTSEKFQVYKFKSVVVKSVSLTRVECKLGTIA